MIEQQLTLPEIVVALVSRMGVGPDMHTHQEQLPVAETGVPVGQAYPGLPQRLHFRTQQGQTGLVGLQDMVLVAGLAIGCDNTFIHCFSGAGEFRRRTEDPSRGIRPPGLVPACSGRSRKCKLKIEY
ncbi:hypothetical protein ES703_105010 [subsurface metagenome]